MSPEIFYKIPVENKSQGFSGDLHAGFCLGCSDRFEDEFGSLTDRVPDLSGLGTCSFEGCGRESGRLSKVTMASAGGMEVAFLWAVCAECED